MCGLLGALLDEPRLTDEQVAGALGRIAHRGPDHTAWRFSKDRHAVLGHVRLSIIGLANGGQPLLNEAADVHCVVNGELYGHRAIRAELAAEGWHFVTDSDSEIALHLYEKLGCDFVHRLRGEFAVVIADERRRCLIAVRDRFGIKPRSAAKPRRNARWLQLDAVRTRDSRHIVRAHGREKWRNWGLPVDRTGKHLRWEEREVFARTDRQAA